ncbi:XdhC family protein [Streptomyces capitiformicae]|uniref:XdhC family protein n=1 Tax=Streptomyces capitiformicae TaxID=2014920 RepID=UPI0016750CF7
MNCSPDGPVTGSVSGGCVEGAVYDLCRQVIRDVVPVLERYGVSDDAAGAVGLTCGGTIEVYVEHHRLPARTPPPRSPSRGAVLGRCGSATDLACPQSARGRWC